MTKTIEFIFDFGSPNAYLSWKVLPEIAARAGTEVKITPLPAGRHLQADQQPFAH